MALLLSSFIVCAQQEDHLILKSELSIRLNDQAVSSVLDSISRKIGYYFSYDPVLIQANRKINVSFSNVSLDKILNSIFKQPLTYKVIQDQIIITKSNKNPEADDSAKNNVSNFLVLSGKIVDLETHSPIPYASVSIWKQPTGTISNIDGNFDLKIPIERNKDTLIFSCLGYQKYLLPVADFEFEKNNIYLRPASIQIKEIKVKAIEANEIIKEMIKNLDSNYPVESYLMTSFYRETLQQDGKYINVSEAVMEILKTSYKSEYREDRTRVIRGRKNNQEQLFRWVDFKMQGGPYYITLLDVVKTRETFLDPAFINRYKYEIDEVIFYRERPTFVITFHPSIRSEQSNYQGKLYIDRETHALVQANFGLGRQELKDARKTMIKKKPKGFFVRPEEVEYQVTYKLDQGKWIFNTAKSQVVFKVKSKNDKINSTYTSVSDLLVTDYSVTDLKRFKYSETFHSNDIFTEVVENLDDGFWGQYNVIKPNENLKKAIRSEKKPGKTNKP